MAGGRPPDELEDWVLATAPRAVAYARSLLRNPHRAEDVVQDCYCRLLAKADVYDLPREGLKLLMRSVTNACINLRTRQRTWFSFSGSGCDADGTGDPHDAAACTPIQHLVAKELSDAVEAGLRALPEVQRAALELKSLGHTQAEIAEILDITSNNVGVLVHRARQTLAEFLTPYLGGEAVR